MINFDKLDKRKTYVCLEYGTSAISIIIDKLTKQFSRTSKAPSHVFALVWNPVNQCWMIYESHMKAVKEANIPSGSRVYSQELFEKHFPRVIQSADAYPCRISKVRLNNLLGLPYGTGDIAELMHASIHKTNGKQKDRKGLICSEYIARCYKRILDYWELKPHCITPAHWLRYFIDADIEPVS